MSALDIVLFPTKQNLSALQVAFLYIESANPKKKSKKQVKPRAS